MANDKTKTKFDWQSLAPKDISAKIDEFRLELFQNRLNARFSHVPTFASNKKRLRKEIARGLTYLNAQF